ncbi:glycoside hydrolase family 72 [Geosmithia morbida]|uniref:1,3-beta-glucanosyltransferase n=1 Tax=Geosmithia morbida TaxID=1094350 RepID=A0A9P4YYT4_9HYPO|nr:glycoside hydrolase family 72 [Geosmithia morbida]KAF4124282.1 glycoside hydrolase family 72 [Geosmithia morbida]
MKASTLFSALATLGAVAATPTPTEKQPPSKRSTLPTIEVSGNAFYSGGKRWYIRGIDYQPGGSSKETDPLADADTCKRDIKKFADLGVNTVRVYAVDNSKDHDECMQALADAGIYLVLDVNTSKYSLNRASPQVSYNADYLQSVFATVDMFSRYTNTFAFFSGNEVINDEADTDKAAPYVKAVTRDIKNYLNSRGLRKVPVGYSAADVASNRMETAHYFNCGSDDMRSDFFAFNDYSWCNSDFKTSGWDQKVKNFTDYGLPIFLSEYGCIENRPRTFDELSALMSTKMSGVYSGGLMYEYSMEGNNYGIVNIDGDDVTPTKEYAAFKSALAKYPTPTGDGDAATTTHSVPCPTKGSSWELSSNAIPDMPSEADQYLKKGAGTGPGLSGSGSQEAGDSGTATASGTSGQASPTATGTQSNDDSDSDGDSAAPTVHISAMFPVVAAVAATFVGTLLL